MGVLGYFNGQSDGGACLCQDAVQRRHGQAGIEGDDEMEAVDGAQAQIKPVAQARRSRVVGVSDRESDQRARNEPIKRCQRRCAL